MKEKTSIKSSVYRQLKDAILQRKLAPGKQLVENIISKSLQVSRTPIRSAIEQLAEEGLVEITPNKGAFVINPSLEEIQQAYELRKELELLSINTAIHSLDEQDYAKLEKIVSEEKHAISGKDVSAYLEANEEFHMTIVKKCGNKFLIEFTEKLIRQTSIYLILFDVYLSENELQPYGYKEHLNIIDLLKQKDLPELKVYLNMHFENAINSLDIKEIYQDLGSIFE